VTAKRDAFLSSSTKRRYREVTLPVCGEIVRIQSLSEREKSEFEAEFYDANGKKIRGRTLDSRARLIMLAVVDDAGERLLMPGDEQSVMQMDSADTGALWEAIWDHIESKTKIEELAKN